MNEGVAFLMIPLAIAGVGYIAFWRADYGCWPWSETAAAIRARDKRMLAYYREYLNYGFDPIEARGRAQARMDKEARDAEGIKP